MTVRSTKRHWRFYKTHAGNSPVESFIEALPSEDIAAIATALKLTKEGGLHVARHLRGPIYEVRVSGPRREFRILFSAEGKFSQVLLAVHAIEKRTQRTPPREIELALTRLSDWHARGELK